MSELTIQKTDSNPFIELSASAGRLAINGNSFVTDPRDFYGVLLSWARDFKSNGKKFRIEITPGYYSTSNIQVFNLIYKTLETNNPGLNEMVFYVEEEEAEDMQETIYSLAFNTGLEPTTVYVD